MVEKAPATTIAIPVTAATHQARCPWRARGGSGRVAHALHLFAGCGTQTTGRMDSE